MKDALLQLGAIAVAAFVFRMWLQDYRAFGQMLAGRDKASRDPAALARDFGGMPGATLVGMPVVAIAVAGALVILGIEVAGEYSLGVTQQQTTMTVADGLYSVLAAAFIEELIFRGFLFYDRGSKLLLAGSCVAVSVIFAVLHPYLWEFPEEASWVQFWELRLSLTAKAFFSTSILFINSLWFYFVRFFRWNPYQSLIPCFAAHGASNLGVFAIKALQGKVEGFY